MGTPTNWKEKLGTKYPYWDHHQHRSLGCCPISAKQKATHTQQARDARVGCISRVQVHFVWVQPSRGDCQMAAEAVDVLD